MRETTGFIGIGNMGLAMALRLRDRGGAVWVRDIDPSRVARAVAHGARAAASPAALAAQCDCVVIAVVDAAQTDDVLFGADGAAAALRSGACVMLCPTIAPASTEAVAMRLAGFGIDCIDAPMSGGPARARDGSMSLMVACSDTVFERHRALIEALSTKVFRMGERPGDGARTKLVNNLLAAVNLAGAAEALALAERVGLDTGRVQAVIAQSSGQSWIGDDRMPRALAGDLAPRAHATLLEKDSRLAVAMAGAAGFDAAVGARASQVFAEACAAGHGAQDDASLLPFLRRRGRRSQADVPPLDPAAPVEGAVPARSLDAATAGRYADCALHSLQQDYPHALQYLMRHADDRPRPRDVHPIFHGSYDWHSSVHMHWSLARLLRAAPALAQRAAVLARFERNFSAEAAARERAHLQANPLFERPYGWAWLMLLQTELRGIAAQHLPAAAWADALEPVVVLLRERWIDFLALAQRPQRAGIHTNSAFAMTLALGHARARGDTPFEGALGAAARRWFEEDVRFPSRYEPNPNDFLSGGLCTAVLMAEVLGADFDRWWQAYAPDADTVEPWLRPVAVSSRTDAQLVHADGLNLSRAWCLGFLARRLPAERRRFGPAREAHLAASLPAVTEGDFVATHWLVSFALLGLTGLQPA